MPKNVKVSNTLFLDKSKIVLKKLVNLKYSVFLIMINLENIRRNIFNFLYVLKKLVNFRKLKADKNSWKATYLQPFFLNGFFIMLKSIIKI